MIIGMTRLGAKNLTAFKYAYNVPRLLVIPYTNLISIWSSCFELWPWAYKRGGPIKPLSLLLYGDHYLLQSELEFYSIFSLKFLVIVS